MSNTKRTAPAIAVGEPSSNPSPQPQPGRSDTNIDNQPSEVHEVRAKIAIDAPAAAAGLPGIAVGGELDSRTSLRAPSKAKAGAAITLGRPSGRPPGEMSAVKFEVPTGPLLQQIESGEVSAFEKLLKIPIPEVLAGKWSHDMVRERAEQFSSSLEKAERNNANIKRFRIDFPRYKQWHEALGRIRAATSAATELHREVEAEQRFRGEAELDREARRALRDGILEWHEHQGMLQLATQYGLELSDVRKAYRKCDPSWSDTREPKKPPATWRRHPDFPGEDANWDLDDLLTALRQRLEIAAELLKENPEHRKSLVAYLGSQPGGERAEQEANNARNVMLTEALNPRVGVFEFLWRMGRPELCLPSALTASRQPAPKTLVRNLNELYDALDAGRFNVEALATLLESGAIERWLTIVAGQSQIGKSAAHLRKSAAGKTHGEREGFLHFAFMSVMWDAGYKNFLLASEGGAAPISTVDELIDKTDTGAAELTDQMLASGLLEAWLEKVAARADLRQLARSIREDEKAAKAERWRQGAGAKRYMVAGVDASTMESFALLALAAARQEALASKDGVEPPEGARTIDDAWSTATRGIAGGVSTTSITYADVVAAIKVGLPQHRYKTANPNFVRALDAIVATELPDREKAFAACLSAGLRYLPLPHINIALLRAEELFDFIHEQGVRAIAAAYLRCGILELWLRSALEEVPEGFKEFCAAQRAMARDAARSAAEQEVSVDALLRYGLQRNSCSVNYQREFRSFSELQRLATEPELFGYLSEPVTREIIRDACGARGGPRLPGCNGDLDAPSEKQLEVFRQSIFAWYWLKVPVLWLGQCERRVTSKQELLEALSDPKSRSMVRDDAADGLVSAWAHHCLGESVPSEFEQGGRVPPENFARFALWLGDVVPAVDLTTKKFALFGEGDMSVLEYTVHNSDPLREIEIEAHLSLPLNLGLVASDKTKRIRLAPSGTNGSSYHDLWRIYSVAGHSGIDQAAIQLVPLGPRNPEPIASALIHCRVRFLWDKLVRDTIAGTVVGIAAAMGVRLIAEVLVGDSTFIARAAHGLQKQSEDSAKTMAYAILTLAILAYRLAFAHSKREDCALPFTEGISDGRAQRLFKLLGRSLPRGDSAILALGTGVLAALVLAPLGAIGGGCKAMGTSAGVMSGCASGATGGGVLGLAIGIYMLARPGSILPKDDKTGIIHDVITAILGIAFYSLQVPIGTQIIGAFDSMDGAALLLVSGGALTFGLALAGWAILGGATGLGFGIFTRLVITSRPIRAWGAIAVIAAVVGVALAGRAKSVVLGPEIPKYLTTEVECRAGASRAAEIAASVRLGPAGAKQYVASTGFSREVDAVTTSCLNRRPKPVTLRCITSATTPESLRKCDPFWL